MLGGLGFNTTIGKVQAWRSNYAATMFSTWYEFENFELHLHSEIVIGAAVLENKTFGLPVKARRKKFPLSLRRATLGGALGIHHAPKDGLMDITLDGNVGCG